jgi:hypothetical protein
LKKEIPAKGDSMLSRIFRLLLVACMAAGTSRAANDPFVGKWKVNPSKSKPTDQMKIEAAGANRYTITFAPGAADTVVADGSDQPALRGSTFSIMVEGPDHWKVIRKMRGRTLLTANWTLSGDGKTLTDAYTEYENDGSVVNLHYVYGRMAGTSGFPGTWVSVGEGVNAVIEFQIEPYEGDGLSFDSPAAQVTKNIKFDGNDYSDLGPNVAPGSTSSGRRVNERSVEITDKFQSKITDIREVELSTDLKTLTITVRTAGQNKPSDLFVFDRE